MNLAPGDHVRMRRRQSRLTGICGHYVSIGGDLYIEVTWSDGVKNTHVPRLLTKLRPPKRVREAQKTRATV